MQYYLCMEDMYNLLPQDLLPISLLSARSHIQMSFTRRRARAMTWQELKGIYGEHWEMFQGSVTVERGWCVILANFEGEFVFFFPFIVVQRPDGNAVPSIVNHRVVVVIPVIIVIPKWVLGLLISAAATWPFSLDPKTSRVLVSLHEAYCQMINVCVKMLANKPVNSQWICSNAEYRTGKLIM